MVVLDGTWSGVARWIVMSRLNTIQRGPDAARAARNDPGPLSAEFRTARTRPAPPPFVAAPKPTRPFSNPRSCASDGGAAGVVRLGEGRGRAVGDFGAAVGSGDGGGCG